MAHGLIHQIPIMKRIILSLLILTTLISGCSKWGYVQLSYPEPPLLAFPENVRSIAVVNRSLVRAGDKDRSVIEAIASAEVAGSDKIASDECIKAIFDKINGWNGINIIIPSTTRLYGSGTRETPEILNWDTVNQICQSANADLLLILETFDSNSDLAVSTVTNQVGAVISGESAPVVPQQIRMNVISFWRLYDPINKVILDQYKTTTYMMFDNYGNGIALPPPDALPQTAYAAGIEYISRFLPSFYLVRRDMYKRGKGDARQTFKRAFRYAELADWDGAMQIWQPLTQHHKRNNAGRACLNMAVACEVKGDFQGAYDWAQKAYLDYRNKTARDYASVLKYRLSIQH